MASFECHGSSAANPTFLTLVDTRVVLCEGCDDYLLCELCEPSLRNNRAGGFCSQKLLLNDGAKLLVDALSIVIHFSFFR